MILDFAMPMMDGFAVFNQLRRINPDAAVVLTSGLETPQVLNWMLANGLMGFIPQAAHPPKSSPSTSAGC